jgi:hypothetical protein
MPEPKKPINFFKKGQVPSGAGGKAVGPAWHRLRDAVVLALTSKDLFEANLIDGVVDPLDRERTGGKL